jgi:3D (Asp-Asp-Asp) domain-containing protein
VYLKVTRRSLFLSGWTVLLRIGAEAKTRWQTFTATAYAVDGQTASGKQTIEGRTVAADPKVLPLGTRIQISGAGPYSGTYVVHDTGRAISGREVDIFLDSPAEAKRFGKKKVRVRILELTKEPAGK